MPYDPFDISLIACILVALFCIPQMCLNAQTYTTEPRAAVHMAANELRVIWGDEMWPKLYKMWKLPQRKVRVSRQDSCAAWLEQFMHRQVQKQCLHQVICRILKQENKLTTQNCVPYHQFGLQNHFRN